MSFELRGKLINGLMIFVCCCIGVGIATGAGTHRETVRWAEEGGPTSTGNGWPGWQRWDSYPAAVNIHRASDELSVRLDTQNAHLASIAKSLETLVKQQTPSVKPKKKRAVDPTEEMLDSFSADPTITTDPKDYELGRPG